MGVGSLYGIPTFRISLRPCVDSKIDCVAGWWWFHAGGFIRFHRIGLHPVCTMAIRIARILLRLVGESAWSRSLLRYRRVASCQFHRISSDRRIKADPFLSVERFKVQGAFGCRSVTGLRVHCSNRFFVRSDGSSSFSSFFFL